MGRYVTRRIEIEATQWFKNGDHPEDNCRMVQAEGEKPFLSEGEVVRRFRHPDVMGYTRCKRGCGHIMHEHGWIENLEEGHTICPGDWIITGSGGNYFPCKPAVFEEMYEEMK